ncbi:MAG: 50S ribosomal protein L32 [Candidatus Harrisonbacteria bacterium RIFCSPLOWO2_01_FULL_40_28]|uniref:Large ribosomal subunit protein bL32 n=2 Tax=Candidatus Harrisoniibacteriota TaxID=1817905 RepID=A0A1G1ZZ53_9BACT|nr:MAG: 50S ribosomal protein L32 [Candidatus Harrisonbacteria bacterium RIFCSPLOWO2_01_FULL_40_28]OGY69862.1 MAG: 50S ribosomal protein L32 [Candidatus Harrisonbacteria bacterium RIFOXYD1_FULL_40_9]
MGGVPVKRHTKSKVGNRRSQLNLRKSTLLPCTNCGAPAMPHKYCMQCGFYRGKAIKEVELEIKKK